MEWGMPFMCSLNMPTLCFILLEFTLWQLEKSISPITVQTFSTSSNVHYSISCLFRSPKTNADPPLYFHAPHSLFTYLLLKCCTAKVCNKIKTRHKRWAPKRQLATKNNISRIFLQFYFLFFVRAYVCV